MDGESGSMDPTEDNSNFLPGRVVLESDNIRNVLKLICARRIFENCLCELPVAGRLAPKGKARRDITAQQR